MNVGLQRILAMAMVGLVTSAASAQGQEEGVSLDAMLQQSEVLTGVDPAVAERFRRQLKQAVEANMSRREVKNELSDDAQLRRLTVSLVQSWMSGDHPQRLFAGWAILILVESIPRDIVVEAAAKEIRQGNHDTRISDSIRDLFRIIYDQDGPGDRPNLSPMIDIMSAVKPKDREPIIAHLLAYSPIAAFRPILEVHVEHVCSVAELSWFDRRVQEAFWMDQHHIQLPQEFKRDFKAGLKLAAKHEVWWVRLYAVELMHDHLGIRDAALARRLSADPHPIVRSRAVRLIDEDSDEVEDEPVVRSRDSK